MFRNDLFDELIGGIGFGRETAKMIVSFLMLFSFLPLSFVIYYQLITLNPILDSTKR